VLLAAVLVGGWYAFLRSSPSYTYDGRSLDKPAGVLSRAETSLDALVRTRHGARDASTRCYFAKPSAPAAGARASDIVPELYCGPVLFVDGVASADYLRFPPAGLSLSRPGGGTPAPSGLQPPAPPPAPENALLAAPLGHSSIPAAPSDAVMVSDTAGIRIEKLGRIARYGSGDSARSEPSGQHLYAFTLAAVAGQQGNTSALPALGVSVDGGTTKPLPSRTGSDVYVLCAPADAHTVELVLDLDGVTQRLSLLDGRPASGNIAVLTRKNFQQTLSVSTPFAFALTKGTQTATVAATLSATRATLDFWAPDGKTHPADTGNAYLVVDAFFNDTAGDANAGFDPSLLTLTPTGGAAIKAQNLASVAGSVLIGFEVPATFTTGTVTVSGSYVDGNGTTEAVAAAVSFPISIPAG
jgi:hypothetical protein